MPLYKNPFILPLKGVAILFIGTKDFVTTQNYARLCHTAI
jgi:hypothetical protein